MHNVNSSPPPSLRFSTNYFSLDFLYVIKMPTTIHLVYILLLLQFILGETLILLDYSGDSLAQLSYLI